MTRVCAPCDLSLDMSQTPYTLIDQKEILPGLWNSGMDFFPALSSEGIPLLPAAKWLPRLRLLLRRALCFVTTVSVACSWRLKGATHTLSPCLLLRLGGVAHVGSRPRSRLDPRGAHEMVISFRRTSSPRLSRPSRRARNSRRLCAREFSLSPTTRPSRLSGCPTRRSRRSTAWSSRRKQ